MGFWDFVGGVMEGLAQSDWSALEGFGGNMSEKEQIQKYITPTPKSCDTMLESVEDELATLLFVGADKTPNTYLGMGYQILMKMEENDEKPKPHYSCPSFCGKCAQVCEECLGARLEAIEAIQLIDDPEGYRDQFVIEGQAVEQKTVFCTLCGAPLEDGAAECIYCGQKRTDPYAIGKSKKIKVASAVDIPSAEIRALELMALSTYYGLDTTVIQFSSYLECQREILSNLDTMQFPEVLKQAKDAISVQSANAMLQEAVEIRQQGKAIQDLQIMDLGGVHQMAQMYGMSVSEYLLARFMDRGVLTMEQYQRRQKNAQMNLRFDELKKKSEESKKEIQNILSESRANRKPPQYSGGASGSSRQCCGTCSNYMPGMARCALRPDSSYQVNATEFCGNYRSK